MLTTGKMFIKRGECDEYRQAICSTLEHNRQIKAAKDKKLKRRQNEWRKRSR